MDIYMLSIPRFRERFEYIHKHVKARSRRTAHLICVDGANVNALPDFLSTSKADAFTPGQIGCAAAHLLACKRIVDSGASSGFIVEDDVRLPVGIDTILDKLEVQLGENEVISLYNRTIRQEKFSRCGAVPVIGAGFSLIYPVQASSMRTSAAYLISRDAAKGLLECNRNLQYVADDWAAFHRSGAIGSIRLAHPIPCRMQSFQSTIGYRKDDSMPVKLRNLLLRSLIGKHLISWRRQLIFWVKERNVILVDEKPSIAANNPAT
jgi:glycosyl transferase family 25